MAEKCGYCGRYMALVDYGTEYGSEWVCSQQDKHIEADPDHWTTPDDCQACNAKLFQCSSGAACCEDCTHTGNWATSEPDVSEEAGR